MTEPLIFELSSPGRKGFSLPEVDMDEAPPLDPNLTRHLTFLGDHLAQNEWFAGPEMTAADIQMSFPLEGAVARAGDAVSPRLTDFVKKFQARPAYKRAIEKGGPYEIAG